jgi:hypothetical protein
LHPEAIIVSYFGLASVLCTVVIAWTLYSAIIRQAANVEEGFVKSMAFAYGVPLLAAALPMFSDSYGETIGYCWIKNDKAVDTLIGFIQFYIPLWVAFGVNSYCYFRVYRVINLII